MGELDGPEELRDQEAVTGHRPAIAPEVPGPLGAGDGVPLGPKLHQLLVKPLDLIDALNDILGPSGNYFFRELVLIKDHHFLDGLFTALQFFAQREKRLGDKGRARKRFQDIELTSFNAFGNFNLAFAGEERDGSHLPEIHAHRVVRLVQRSRRQIEFDVLRNFIPLELIDLFQPQAFGRFDLGRIQYLDARVVEHREEVVEIFRRMNVGR